MSKGEIVLAHYGLQLSSDGLMSVEFCVIRRKLKVLRGPNL